MSRTGHRPRNESLSPSWLFRLILRFDGYRYLGLMGVPQPLQQQQAEPYTPAEDPSSVQANIVCSALTALSAEQIEVCMKHPSIIYSVANGAHKGIQECQYQFRNERWNCTTNDDDEDVFGYILKTGKLRPQLF